MSNFTIHVDEFGSVSLNKPEHAKKYPFFVLGFVFCKNPEQMRKGMARLLIRLCKRKRYHLKTVELKFNLYRALEIRDGGKLMPASEISDQVKKDLGIK